MNAHDHAGGLFCDDCPDALRQNLRRLLVLHQWVRLPDPTADCTCGWVMPFTETQQHEAHQADVIAAELTRLGWSRPTPTAGSKVEGSEIPTPETSGAGSSDTAPEAAP